MSVCRRICTKVHKQQGNRGKKHVVYDVFQRSNLDGYLRMALPFTVSVGLIFCGPFKSVQSFMAIHPIVV